MTEAEWLSCADPKVMLTALPPRKGTRRKRQLFACACCRLIWDLLPAEAWRTALEVNERLVEGKATENQRANAFAAAARPGIPISAQAAARTCRTDGSSEAAEFIAYYTAVADKDTQPLMADLLRDIFGNPFRPVARKRAWLTSDVLALARGIYEEKAFDRMPILADALQDAGCANDEVLNHCRSEGPHVRGCWVVDLVMGKA